MEEFGANLAARIDGGAVGTAPATAAPAPVPRAAPAAVPKPAPEVVHEAASAVAPVLSDSGEPIHAARPHVTATRTTNAHEREPAPGWWSRLLGARNGRSAHVASADRSIRIEIRQLDKTIHVEWPLEGADQCKDWLRELLAK